MLLEETIEQYECLHYSWEKVVAPDEIYFRCRDCGATNSTPEPKTAPTPIPEWKRSPEAFSNKDASESGDSPSHA